MDIPTLSLTSWAGLAAAGALVATAWRQVLGLVTRIGDIFVCRTVVGDEAARAVLTHAWQYGRRSPFSLQVYGGTRSYVHPQKRVEAIAYQSISSDPVLVWFNGRPVVMALHIQSRGSGELLQFGESSQQVPLHMWSLRPWWWLRRFSFDVEAFIQRALEEYNTMHCVARPGESDRPARFDVIRIGGSSRSMEHHSQDQDRKLVPTSPSSNGGYLSDALRTKTLRLLRWKPEDLVPRGESREAFEYFPYPDSIMSALDEIKIWLECETWFRSKGVPWRRGWLLHGPPGTGKSNLAKCIAVQFDLPIYQPDLSGMSNNDFVACWSRAQSNAPAIMLLEDFDNVFHGRKNIIAEGKQRDLVTFDCILNTISGAGNSEGVFLIVTTNQLNKIDTALGIPDDNGVSSRPGRIDTAVYVGPMEEPQRKRLAEIILSDFPEYIEETVKAGNGETAGQFQNRCAQLALSLFWKTRKSERKALAA